jgi:hypothetical protein
VAESPGRQLLTVLQRELVHSLHDAVAELAGDLGALSADPDFDATPFAGRVLGAVQPENAVLSALSGLSSGSAGPARAGLHGWRDEAAEEAARGVGYVVRSGDGAVAALSVVPAAGVRLTLRAAGLTGQSLELPLANGFTLRLAGAAAEQVEVAFFPDQPPAVARLAPGDRVEVELRRDGVGDVVGVDGGPSVLFGAVTVGGWLASDPAGRLTQGAQLTLRGGEVALAPGFLKGLLPVELTFPLDVELRAAPGTAGVTLAGSPSLRTRLTGSGAGRWLDLAADVVDSPGGPALRISAQTSIEVSLPGAPVSTHVDGVGLALPISLGRGTTMLPDATGIQALQPQGAGVSLDLPVVSGSGVLARVGDDLAGALSVRIPPMSAAAFGVLSPARDADPLSFLVIMGATFPPPGVQIGFGFAVSGLGGVVGVNRRIDREAMIRAVVDGSAAQLLFPSDPAAAGQAAIRALPAVFPAARGSVVAGPMFQLNWGGRVLTLSVAVLVESSVQVRQTIIGKLVVALPDPDAPLVFLQATFAGVVNPAEPSAQFVASLTGSHIVGAPLSGDLLMLTRGGSDATLVVSAGGFHPAFRVPRGVPTLRRLSMDLCPVPWLDLRSDSYFALTPNTLQLGARLELVAEVDGSGCGLRGHLSFDALLQYSPFRFIADVSGGIALRAFGQTLIGVHLALHLEGPAPYLARGRGSIDLFLFEVSFDFEAGWGSPPPAPSTPPDVGDKLRKAIAEPTAWRSRGTAPSGLALRVGAQKALAAGTVVDAYGTVSVRQEQVPLGLEIRRFQGLPVPPQRWDIQTGEFGPGEPAARTAELRAEFAPGQFVPSRSDDEALTAAAFLPLRAGVELFPAPATGAAARAADLTWEEKVVARDVAMPVPEPAGELAALLDVETLLTAMSPTDPGWWAAPDQEVVTVDPAAPVVAASAWSMTGFGITAATSLELAQAPELAGGDLMTVEAWEL